MYNNVYNIITANNDINNYNIIQNVEMLRQYNHRDIKYWALLTDTPINSTSNMPRAKASRKALFAE